MEPKRGRIGRTGKVLIAITAVISTIATLLYFEQVAIIYIGSTLALIILLILVGFSDLEEVGKKAADEAYLTRRSEGVFPETDVIASSKITSIRNKQQELKN